MSYASYVNFTLTLHSVDTGRATVEVTSSSVGELSPTPIGLPAALSRVRDGDEPPVDAGELPVLGTALFDCLFPPPVRGLYRAALTNLPPERGLRIRLQTDSSELAAIPWEYAYDHEAATWLALDPRTLVVRYYALPFQPGTLPRPAPLRILVVLAAPKDMPRVDLEGERRHLDETFRDLQRSGRVEIGYLDPPATAERLHSSLRQGVDVLHYVGHGTQLAAQGALVLERDDAQSHLLFAEDVAMLLRRTGVRLVCLNACLTGVVRGQLFGGVGPALVQADIPAVVAMHYALPDQSALRFTRAFYAAIADGEPVDAATTTARVALRIHSGASTMDWGYPMLLMRAPSGELWGDQGAGLAGQKAQPCPSCGKSVAAQARFCSTCGVALVQGEAALQPATCPTCGQQNRPGSRFCASCGAALGSQVSRPVQGVQIGGSATVQGIIAGNDANVTISAGDLSFGQSVPSGTSGVAGAGSAASQRGAAGNG